MHKFYITLDMKTVSIIHFLWILPAVSCVLSYARNANMYRIYIFLFVICFIGNLFLFLLYCNGRITILNVYKYFY